MALTDTSAVTPNISGAIASAMVLTPEVNLAHALFAKDQNVPPKSGSKVTFRRPTKPALATSALSEGTDPTSTTGAVTDVTLTAAQYGMFYEFTDLSIYSDPWDIVATFVPMLGTNAAETIDKLIQAVAVAGSNVRYANNVAARANVAQKLVIGDILAAEATLATNGARKITGIINAGLGVNTYPVPPAYVMIAHPYVCRDIRDLSGFIPVQQYAASGQALPGEFGLISNTRVIMSQNADAGTVLGTAGTTVYRNDGANFYVFLCPMFGQDAFAFAHWGGVASTADEGTTALKLTKRFGWKVAAKAGRLVENYLYRLECAASL
jgi:N4-gp56 family major capsid protein